MPAASSSLPPQPYASESKTGGLILKEPDPEEDLPPNPFEASTQPLRPRTVDKLVEAKSSRIRNCYDMARITDPYLEGTLELIIGISGDNVRVTVKKNELTTYLAACVTRVIKSIEPTPNNGTLVEILKEFEFKSAN